MRPAKAAKVAVRLRFLSRIVSYQICPAFDPSVTAQRRRDQVEGVVGDAGIDVDPAIVLRGMHIVLHVGRLRVLSEHVVIVGRAGGLHRAQRLVLEGQQARRRSASPLRCAVCFSAYCLTSEPNTSETDARSTLPTGRNTEAGFGSGDAVGQLMPDHVQGNREAVEDDAVAVAEHHLVAVPEGVVEVLVVVDGGDQRQSVIIDRIALIVLQIEIEGAAEAVVSLVDL